MSNILTYGSYTVGSTNLAIYRSIHDVIHLHLNIDKPVPKKVYTLDELQDLESRLVLITGSDSPQTNEVESYLKVSFL